MFSKSELNRLKEYGRLAIAVSGGKDSMALLHWIISNRERVGDNFFVVNIEHGIRGKSSTEDSEFVINYCKENNVECVSIKADVPMFCTAHGVGHEQGARMLRHSIFKELVQDGKADKIVLAHHLNDQAESILMHIFRGTGIKGLVGMQKENGHLVRPLLDVGRQEIDTYVAENDVAYVQDESNFDLKYTRNFIRNEIMPLVENRYPSVMLALQRLSNNAQETLDFRDQFLSKQIDKNSDGSISIKLSALMSHPALQKANVIKCFEGIGVFADIEERHLQNVIGLMEMPNGSSLDMPYDTMVCKEYEELVFARRMQVQAFIQPFGGESVTIPDGSKVEVSEVSEMVQGEGILYFDAGKLPKDCVLRTMQMGDVFKKYNGKTKKLCDWLTDIKMPKRLRHNLIILAKGSTVYAVLGSEIADEIKVDEKTLQIKKIVLRRNY